MERIPKSITWLSLSAFVDLVIQHQLRLLHKLSGQDLIDLEDEFLIALVLKVDFARRLKG